MSLKRAPSATRARRRSCAATKRCWIGCCRFELMSVQQSAGPESPEQCQDQGRHSHQFGHCRSAGQTVCRSGWEAWGELARDRTADDRKIAGSIEKDGLVEPDL